MVDENVIEIKRRIERLEQNQIELQALLRESSLIDAKINETLIEMKEDFKCFKVDLRQIRELEIEISNLKMGFAAVKWVAGSLFGTFTLGFLSYLFKFGSGVGP